MAHEHAAWRGHQRLEHAKLGRRDLHYLVVARNAVPGQIDDQAFARQRILRRLRGPASQYRFDSGDEFLKAEGLDNEVVGSKGESFHLIVRFSQRGEDKNGNRGRISKTTADLSALEVRQHQIENHQQRIVFGGEIQRLSPVVCRDRIEALVDQINAEKLHVLRSSSTMRSGSGRDVGFTGLPSFDEAESRMHQAFAVIKQIENRRRLQVRKRSDGG